MAYRKLGRNTGHRGAMLRNIVTSLLKYERIETTEARAKELNAIAEKMITLGKQGDLAARRQALAYLMDEDVVKKLFDTIAPKYARGSLPAKLFRTYRGMLVCRLMTAITIPSGNAVHVNCQIAFDEKRGWIWP